MCSNNVGDCFKQLPTGVYDHTTGCGNCELVRCEQCLNNWPESLIEPQNKRFCLKCESDRKIWTERGLDYREPGYCWRCLKKLVHITVYAKKGKRGSEWATRKYHRRCWFQHQREEAEKDRIDESDDNEM
jgi:hypothetical protein